MISGLFFPDMIPTENNVSSKQAWKKNASVSSPLLVNAKQGHSNYERENNRSPQLEITGVVLSSLLSTESEEPWVGSAPS